jgi:hypothetical protein
MTAAQRGSLTVAVASVSVFVLIFIVCAQQ